MNCPNCGSEVPGDSTFCHTCGASLTPPTAGGEVSSGISRRVPLVARGAALVIVVAGVVGILAVVGLFEGDGGDDNVVQGTPIPTSSPLPRGEDVGTPTPASQSEALIVYAIGGSVYVIRADGSDKRKLFDAGPNQWALSPDGTRLAYIEPGDPFKAAMVYVVPVAGGEPQGVFDGEAFRLSWSPGGSILQIDVRSVMVTSSVWIRFAEGVAPETVAEWTSGTRDVFGTLRIGTESIPAAPLPGRSTLAFTQDDHLMYTSGTTTHIYNFALGNETTYPGSPPQGTRSPDGRWEIKDSQLISIQDGTSRPFPVGNVALDSWSPDSQFVVAEQPIESQQGTSYALFAVNVATAEAVRLTQPSAARLSGPFVWSDDSRHVYFGNMFRANADGSGGQKVSPADVRFCRTPRGQAVALEEENHPGIGPLRFEQRTTGDVADCVTSADFRFALQVNGGALNVYDLTTGENAPLVSRGVSFAAWAGSCATDGCPAAVVEPTPTPPPTPYSGNLPEGVTPITPFFARSIRELRLRSEPSLGSSGINTSDVTVEVIGEVATGAMRWYYLARGFPANEEARYVPAGDVRPVGEQPGGPEGGAPMRYTLQEGDTLFGIAGVLGVTVEDLLAFNNLTEEEWALLQPGDEILIP